MKTGTLATRLNRFGMIIAVGVVALIVAMGLAGSQIRVGGPIYQRVILSKDLVADILPPPEYVIEAYLEATLAVNQPSEVAKHAARLAQLHKDYDDRRAYWLKSQLPDGLRDKLVKESDAEVQAFWASVEKELIPALRSGNTEQAKHGYDDASAAYARHRAVIDDVVKDANALSESTEHDASLISWIAFGVVGSVSLGVLIMLHRGLNGFRRDAVEPVIDVTAVISALAAGDMQVAARHGDRQDEVGAMARAIEVFRANALAAEEARAQADALKAEQARILAAAAVQQQQVVDTLAERLKSMAGGRLDCSINEFFPDDYKRLRMDFNAAVTELSSALEDIRVSSHNVASAAVQLGEGASDISRRAEHQAATLEETAAAHDQITATVTTTLSVARETAEMVAFAQERAQSSKGVVGEAVDAIRAIEKSSRQISQIIGVIDEIAFQTNLLALNAGVEAARAGDAGRGFAVVAMEVRALAQRSAEAAKEIRGLINDAERSVGEGVRLVDATGTALNEIVDEVAEIAGRVRHIASSAQEQSVALEEVNRAISALDTVTQQNAAVAEESATACHSLQDEADRLVNLVGRFVTTSSAQTSAQFGSGNLSSAA